MKKNCGWSLSRLTMPGRWKAWVRCTADYGRPEHTMLCCTYITVCVYVIAKEITGNVVDCEDVPDCSEMSPKVGVL